MTISGSLFCLLVSNQKHFPICSSYYQDDWFCRNFFHGCISIPILLFLGLVFTLVLKCKRKSMCWGVALSNVQHFDINEWDVIEVEKEKEQEENQEIEMREIVTS